MTWSEYKIESARTFAYFIGARSKMENKLDQMHCAIGISTEIAELMNAVVSKDKENAIEEIGDIFWYLSNLERLMGVDSEHLPDPKGRNKIFLDEWLCGHQELVDHYKKAVFYGSDVNAKYVKQHIATCNEILIALLYTEGISVQDVLTKNISKLKKRYPYKFTKEAAENRDINKEKNVFK